MRENPASVTTPQCHKADRFRFIGIAATVAVLPESGIIRWSGSLLLNGAIAALLVAMVLSTSFTITGMAMFKSFCSGCIVGANAGATGIEFTAFSFTTRAFCA